MDRSLSRVIERFKDVREHAARLFERDDNFRDLCEDYQACSETVVRLESDDRSSEAMRHEYGALLLRLERELLRYLEEHPT